MGGFSRYGWVTQCIDERNVTKALVLGKSLRNVLTKASLVVIIHSKTISKEENGALREIYDFVLSLDQVDCGEWNIEDKNYSSEILGKITALSLTFLEKGIFFNPNCIVIRNCDHMFETSFDSTGNTFIQINEECNYPCAFQPSFKAFNAAKKLIMDADNENVVKNGEVFNTVKISQEDKTTSKWRIIKNPDFEIVNPMQKHIFGDIGHLSIVYLANLSKDEANEGIFASLINNCEGIVEKEIYRRWLDLYNEVRQKESLTVPRNLPYNEKVAVVGMSCRFPGANSVAEFWEMLMTGKDGITSPPLDRWAKEKYPNYKPVSENLQAGYLSVPIDEFDSKFFEISPKEAVFLDPQLRILMEVVWESLEDAGINPVSLNGATGSVFLGTWSGAYQQIVNNSVDNFFRAYLGNASGAMVARIAHFLGLKGPCVGTESDCAAGLLAVHMACNSLRNGESSIALACGANLFVEPFYEDTLPSFVAPDGHSKTFDASADGFGRAEGCAVLILKRYSDAVKDGDRILGLIRGSAISQEGMSKSIGTPTLNCEAETMQNALKAANVHPSEVSYVEAHGTGTIVGDPLEVLAIEKAYGGVERAKELIIGSVKTNVGHTESCSGITGIIKVILSMQNECIPQHRNFTKLNPKLTAPLHNIPAIIPLEVIPWKKTSGKPRVAGISSFGVAGADGHLILEEPLIEKALIQNKLVCESFERPLHILTITAKTEAALNMQIHNLKKSFTVQRENKEFKKNEMFANLAFTANVGKVNAFPFRAAIIVSDVDNGIKCLDSGSYLKSDKQKVSILNTEGSMEKGKVCFLYPGQGCQYHGMAKQLYETSPVFRIHFDYCKDYLQANYDLSIKQIYFGDETNEDEIKRTINSQTGIFVVEYSLTKLWESWGIKPNVVVGHSLGEFCAAVCADIIDVEDALRLVAERSQLIDSLPEGSMLAVKADRETTLNFQKEFFGKQREKLFASSLLDFAAFNSSDQTVVAGDTEKVSSFSEYLSKQGIKQTFLKSSHAFHSRHMDPMLNKYQKVAESISYRKPQSTCKFISGMLGKVLDGETNTVNADYWVAHNRNPVNFLAASKVAFNEENCQIFLEMGPQPILSALAVINNSSTTGVKQESHIQMMALPSLRRNESNWKTLLNSLGKLFVEGGLSPNWEGFDQLYNRKKVGHLLPFYPFQKTKYWITSDSKSAQPDFHPLLGHPLSNPTKSAIFQNQINLDSLEYLKDHMLENVVLFPSAGYMEMLLSAGFHTKITGSSLYSQTTFPEYPVYLANFQIQAPLSIKERVHLQTVVESTRATNINGENSIKIYHEETTEGLNSWILHVSASFNLFNEADGQSDNELTKFLGKSKNLILLESLKSKQILDNIKTSLYEKQSKLGLKFGTAFQTLLKTWKSDENAFLSEVISPKEASSYLLHPTLIDGMIQATVFFEDFVAKNSEIKLKVPVSCRKFIWFRKLSTPKCYVFTKPTKTNENSAFLFDEEGNLISALLGTQVATTNVSTIKSSLESQVKRFPNFYKTKWSPISTNLSIIPLQHSALTNTTALNSDKSFPTWVIFYDAESPNEMLLANNLQTSISQLGTRNVIRVKLVDSIPDFKKHKDPTDTLEIGADNKADMENLFDRLFCKGNQSGLLSSNVEGIIVTWGLRLRSERRIVPSFLYLIQNLLALPLAQEQSRKCVLFTNGQFLVENTCYSDNPSASPLIGMVKALLNESRSINFKIIDVILSDLNPHSKVAQTLLQEIFGDSEEKDPKYICAFRNDMKYVPKIIPDKSPYQNRPLNLIGDRFQLIHPTSRNVEDLEFGHLEVYSLKPTEIEVEVKGRSLNFKDVLCVMKPTDMFKDQNDIGNDISGVVIRIGKNVTKWKVGDFVYGMKKWLAFPSHVCVEEDCVWEVPERLTLEEASTFPVVFLTAYHSFVDIAKVQKGETVLIHTASGGVGLVAIQVAKQFGLNIICTAGSRRKQAYLKSLGIQHVFKSRSTEFSKQILELTKGKGVDVVLNTLTGEGFKEATAAACGNGARFLEISKLNIWSMEEVKAIRPDLKYSIIDVSEFIENPDEVDTLQRALSTCTEWLKNGLLHPIPYTRFDGVNVRDALKYLQTARHIGKVVCTLPELRNNNSHLAPLFNERSTYLITGGLGEIGTEVCKYMTRQGARHFLLIGRNLPSAGIAAIHSSLKDKHNCKIIIFQGDIGCWETCQKLIPTIKEKRFPPLRGVMHVAGCLSDGLLQNISWENFDKTFRSKVDGSWNLHELTKNLILEHFVLFSSVVAKVGSPGQATHSSACSFQDGLAHFRNSHGLRATTINWGQWGEIGCASNLESPFLRPFSPKQGINALNLILRNNLNNKIVVNLNNISLEHQRYSNWILQNVNKSKVETSVNSEQECLVSNKFWSYYVGKANEEEKLKIVGEYVATTIKQVLQLDSQEKVDETEPLEQMGMDSLMMLELQNRLQTILGQRVTLPPSAVRDCANIHQLKLKLINIIEGNGNTENEQIPTIAEVHQLILQDSKLPEYIKLDKPGSEVKPSEIKKIFMTGATGLLGCHMIKELMEHCPNLEVIYCLVRGKSHTERLHKTLNDYDIFLSPEQLKKIVPISGNFAVKGFGIDSVTYNQLCSETDAVIHFGAKISYTEYYKNLSTERITNDIRKTNVGGILNILEFACKSKTKHVFNASTMLTATEMSTDDGTLLETWPNADTFAICTTSGYVASKWACDFLLKEATEKRGIPCKSFRYPELRGSTFSRKGIAVNSLTMKTVLYCFKEGVIPNSPMPLICLPVDVAAKLTIPLMFTDDTPNDLYNVLHPIPQLFLRIMLNLGDQIGHPVKIIDFEEYKQRILTPVKIQKSVGVNDGKAVSANLLSEFWTTYNDDNLSWAITQWLPFSIKDDLETKRIFASKKLQKFASTLYKNIEPAEEILKRDVLTAKSMGLID